MTLRKPQAWLPAAVFLYLLFFFHLSATGMLGPDEPRYASIAREMSRSGDWITPRLWGEPWFEKPALQYWMAGAAFRFGLGDDLAPRLPVAAMSAAFLVFFFLVMRREFGAAPAIYATAILATSAGWVAYSQVGVPDMALAVTFSSAMLLALRWLHTGDRRVLPWAAALLGLAVLAKGLVPLALIVPILVAGRSRWRDLLHPVVWGVFLLVSLPWYVLCFLHNGPIFLEKLFWEHHVQRLASSALAHVQPVWFYVPVFLAGVFPWTPALAMIRRRDDPRWRAMLFLVLFGLVFFSIFLNKLPGYLLPLLPAAAALLGIAWAERDSAVLRALCALAVGFIPALAAFLPRALALGISQSRLSVAGWMWGIPVLLCLAVVRLRAAAAMAVLVTAATAGVTYVKIQAMPALEQAYSARPIWREIAARSGQVCVDKMERSWRYGLNYYSVTPLPDCDEAPRPLRIVQEPDRPPELRSEN